MGVESCESWRLQRLLFVTAVLFLGDVQVLERGPACIVQVGVFVGGGASFRGAPVV